jgi:hypothetical protein
MRGIFHIYDILSSMIGICCLIELCRGPRTTQYTCNVTINWELNYVRAEHYSGHVDMSLTNQSISPLTLLHIHSPASNKLQFYIP